MRGKSLLQQKPELGIFQDILKGIFLRRPNRFIVECLVGSKTTPAYLPNPGRLSELLLPGRTVYLVRNRLAPVVSTGHTAVAIKRDGVPVMLHTHHTNRVARVLIEQNKIPRLEDWDIVRPEVMKARASLPPAHPAHCVTVDISLDDGLPPLESILNLLTDCWRFST